MLITLYSIQAHQQLTSSVWFHIPAFLYTRSFLFFSIQIYSTNQISLTQNSSTSSSSLRSSSSLTKTKAKSTKMLKTKTLKMKAFQGANVFMSRNLVPPEVFDALHDAVKDNGAQLHLCCDPSRNGPDDYHIIASSKHVSSYSLCSRSFFALSFLIPLCFAGEVRWSQIQGLQVAR